jgi:putative transposase
VIHRTERIWLKPSSDIGNMCHIAKNLFNEANYMVRQEFINNGKWIRYNMLALALKTSDNYKTLPAQSAQQILKQIDWSWKSFFQAIKAWNKDKTKFKKQPKLPRYKNKDGEFILIFTSQQVKIHDGQLVFPKKANFLNGIKTRIDNLQEVRIIPKAIGYILEIVYEKNIKTSKRNRSRVAGIDIGVRNLVTVVNNFGERPIVVKGGTAKAMNQYYNKKKARLQSIYDQQKIKTGMTMKRLIVSRDKKMRDYLHQVSHAIVNYLVEHDIGLLVIGHNDNWKQNVNIGKRNNQSFVSIPFNHLIHMVQYKAEEQGTKVIIKDESHTSKCSFFDLETVEHHDKYVGKRMRGLFRTAKGLIVNADVNGALNIIRKAVPNAFANGIEGAVSHPLRLTIPFWNSMNHKC